MGFRGIILEAVGVCWKKGDLLISLYMRIGDAYLTLRVRRLNYTVKWKSKATLKASMFRDHQNLNEMAYFETPKIDVAT